MTTDTDQTDATDSIDIEDIPTYRAPRRGKISVEDLPLDPADGRKLDRQLNNYPSTGLERDLRMVAGNIRSAEAATRSNLKQTSRSPGGDPRDATINPNREAIRNPGGFPAARRANTHQSNLESHYRRFADLCERHFRLIREQLSSDE